MIRKLLAFARKDTKSMNPLQVSVFLKEVIKLSVVSIPENIRFIDNVSTQDVHIMGDINLLQQVIINMLNNARDAVTNNSGEKVISIDLTVEPGSDELFEKHPELKGDTFACIEITDNGCGIPEDDVARIFEPFYTTKEVDKGTGLGLAMSYGAIQSHHGAIDVATKLTEGSTFKIYIPALKENEIVLLPDDPKDLSKGSGETILLVDDEQSITDTGRAVLESIGYNVMVAGNGQEAVNLFEAHKSRIDMMISDVVMPVKDGVVAAKEIRAMAPDIKLLFTTGYDHNKQITSDRELKGEAVLLKPFSAIDLSQKVAEVLNK